MGFHNDETPFFSYNKIELCAFNNHTTSLSIRRYLFLDFNRVSQHVGFTLFLI